MIRSKKHYLWCATLGLLVVGLQSAYATEERTFNEYILRAVDVVAGSRAGLGYDKGSYTQDLKFGNSGTLIATRPPYTMCVAAQVEVMHAALDLYWRDNPKSNVFSFLPFEQWQKLRPGTLRGKIWLVEDSGSWGTAYALEYFGMGEQRPFDKLTPGSLINLNREKTGHAVIFLAYIDKTGSELNIFSDAVAGFKYFSAQGSRTTGGFGYRYGFFREAGCPVLDDSKRRDCGIIRSVNARVLNTGVMLNPHYWDPKKRDKALAFSRATQKGPELDVDMSYFDGRTTDD
ncbi:MULTISPECIES: hypothetical protein [unclassified Variovorax]|uniref:hypothetical protein n=1 Tax=unclassified Variovorax TaxID=663243 RepID=UPI001BD26325|nr:MULTISPECIES: hypothetical protein [unclassified Variovorax]